MKALIFGINGQDGYYIKEICREKKIDVIGISRSSEKWIKGDVGNFHFVENLVKTHKPEYIFHLAANSTTNHDAIFENHKTISTGTINILEAVKRHNPVSKVFITGSGLQFENKGLPIKETDNFQANNPYSLARIHSVYVARYFRSLGIHVYIGYLFHHESPFRKAHHISQKIAIAARKIAEGKNEKIELGDISVEKEWTFAGDIAKAIFTLIEQEDIFEATIGSGIAYSIENWIEMCFRIIGKDWKDYIILRQGYIPEYKLLVSNPRTINLLGWYPVVQFNELAEMMMKN
jgi:GDPmannose 4,6-dehydratase